MYLSAPERESRARAPDSELPAPPSGHRTPQPGADTYTAQSQDISDTVEGRLLLENRNLMVNEWRDATSHSAADHATGTAGSTLKGIGRFHPMPHSSSERGAHLLSFAHVLPLQCPSRYPSRWQLAKCHQTSGMTTNAAASQAHSRARGCFQTGKAGGAVLLSDRDLATKACHHHYREVLLGHRGEPLGRAFPGSSQAQQFVVRAPGAWCAYRDLVSSALPWCGVRNGMQSEVAASPFPEVAGLRVANARMWVRVKRAHAPPSQLRAGQDGLVRAPMRHGQMTNARSQSFHTNHAK